jgi:hypothetical protein
MTCGRISDLQNFYGLLGSLAERVGGPRTLAACSGRLGWPRRGVYFFMEDGEIRSDSGTGPRIVRVGTHALTKAQGRNSGADSRSIAVSRGQAAAITGDRFSD